MKLEIPQDTIVIRKINLRDKTKGQWHIFTKSNSNGFTEKNVPDYPNWWNSKSHHTLCGKYFDDRKSEYGFLFDYSIEFATVTEIKKICPSCWPYQKTQK